MFREMIKRREVGYYKEGFQYVAGFLAKKLSM